MQRQINRLSGVNMQATWFQMIPEIVEANIVDKKRIKKEHMMLYQETVGPLRMEVTTIMLYNMLKMQNIINCHRHAYERRQSGTIFA